MTTTVTLASSSGRCSSCKRTRIPTWLKDGRAMCATCCVKGAAVGTPVAFGTESDKQEAGRREKTPTG